MSNSKRRTKKIEESPNQILINGEVLESVEKFLKPYNERMDAIKKMCIELQDATPANIDKKIKQAMEDLKEIQKKYKFDPKILN